MSCAITTGKSILCQNDVGGIDQILLISGIDDNKLLSVTVTGGEATAVETDSGSEGTWFQIDLDKYQSNFNQTIVTRPRNSL